MLLREFALSEFHFEKVLYYISSYSKYTNGYIEFFSRTCLGILIFTLFFYVTIVVEIYYYYLCSQPFC